LTQRMRASDPAQLAEGYRIVWMFVEHRQETVSADHGQEYRRKLLPSR